MYKTIQVTTMTTNVQKLKLIRLGMCRYATFEVIVKLHQSQKTQKRLCVLMRLKMNDNIIMILR